MSPKRALKWVLIWVLVAMGFAALLFRWGGPNAQQLGTEFLTCYIIEWTLSVDNLFVFLMIFRAFGVDHQHQRRALQWGIIGAIVSRMVFILIGLGLVTLFEPVMYVFGLILLYSGYQMAFKEETEEDFKENRYVRWVQRFLPVTHEVHGDRFFVRKPTGLLATPLFLVLVVIDIFDLMFAVDSIPAAFAISRHPMVILSANAFAIMGLRSLYFLLEHANRVFKYLKYGVALVLTFVGLKMLSAHFLKIETSLSLVIVVGTLGISILVSLVSPRGKEEV